MRALVAAALVALAGPAFAQDQQGNVERVETPEGTVTVVRPTPRAQPAAPEPRVNPDPIPPPPVTPFPTDQDGRSPWATYGVPYGGPYSTPYPPYGAFNPPIVVIQRRTAPMLSTTPGAPLQSRDGFGRPLPSPRFPPNQFGPGAVPGTVPLPDASQIIILRR
jgi:hypothetical protein